RRAVRGEPAATRTTTAGARIGPGGVRLADAAAAGYLGVLRDQARATAATAAANLQRQYDDLRRRLDALGPTPRTPGDAALAAALQDQLRDVAGQQNRLRLAAATYQPLVPVGRPAIRPAAPASPVPLRDAGLAGLVALLLSAAAAWAFEVYTQRRSDTGRFTRVLGVPCLGRVPAIPTMPVRDPATGAPPIAVHWQQLVSAVDASLREPGGGCLLITAPG